MEIAIIGSRVAGLTVAAYLAQSGSSVTVFEQYHRPGGVTAPLEWDGFNWDLGRLIVEGLGPDEPMGLILAELGLADKVRIPHRTPIRGLWFIGAQSESGGGVNNVIPAAYKVAKMIAEDA